MNGTRMIVPTTSCLALAVRKDHTMMMIEKTAKKTAILSWKVILTLLTLTITNIFI